MKEEEGEEEEEVYLPAAHVLLMQNFHPVSVSLPSVLHVIVELVIVCIDGVELPEYFWPLMVKKSYPSSVEKYSQLMVAPTGAVIVQESPLL